MQNYTATTRFAGDGDTEIAVASSRCLYDVWISKEEVTLRGPGVEEVEDIWPEHQKLSREDQAITVVILFENGLWPEE